VQQRVAAEQAWESGPDNRLLRASDDWNVKKCFGFASGSKAVLDARARHSSADALMLRCCRPQLQVGRSGSAHLAARPKGRAQKFLVVALAHLSLQKSQPAPTNMLLRSSPAKYQRSQATMAGSPSRAAST
jgi:hypothetical protein